METSGKLDAVAQNMESDDIRQLTATINDLDKVLNTGDMVRKAKLPENVFKNHFLPALSGKVVEGDISLMKYIEYAGSPYAEVDIIDARGEVLFTCPPVYNRSQIKTGKENIPYTEIAGTYELKKARMPNEGTNYMAEVVGGIRNNVDIEEVEEVSMTWEKIISRYDDTKETVANMINNPTVSDEELEELIDYD